jgi:hypothetical protein
LCQIDIEEGRFWSIEQVTVKRKNNDLRDFTARDFVF